MLPCRKNRFDNKDSMTQYVSQMRLNHLKPQTLSGIEQNQRYKAKEPKVLKRILQSLGLRCGGSQQIQKRQKFSSDLTHTWYQTIIVQKIIVLLNTLLSFSSLRYTLNNWKHLVTMGFQSSFPLFCLLKCKHCSVKDKSKAAD